MSWLPDLYDDLEGFQDNVTIVRNSIDGLSVFTYTRSIILEHPNLLKCDSHDEY